jgi:hypothetical protein
MKISLSSSEKLALAGLLAGCLVMTSAIPVRAALGGDAKSIDADVSAMQGTMSQPTASEPEPTAYTVKTFVTDHGTKVREYAAPSGAIFGVAWQGRRPPDLSVLLGPYYSEYASAAAAQRHKDLHRTRIETPDAVVMMAGHMGHAVGHAYVPSLVPSGVDPKAVVK